MPERVVRVLRGHSNSRVELIGCDDQLWIRKSGDIARNIERMHALRDIMPFPQIIRVEDDMYEMEYIYPHQDMASWLTYNQPVDLIQWLHGMISRLQADTRKDYTDTYRVKLSNPSLGPWWPYLPFDQHQLIVRLPSVLPAGPYHGDFTLENILHSPTRGFVTIDPLTSPYDSWVFDLAKLSQDLLCGWFIRHTRVAIDAKLATISNSLAQRYRWWADPHLAILMLLRVLPYTSTDADRRWLLTEIGKLWK